VATDSGRILILFPSIDGVDGDTWSRSAITTQPTVDGRRVSGRDAERWFAAAQQAVRQGVAAGSPGIVVLMPRGMADAFVVQALLTAGADDVFAEHDRDAVDLLTEAADRLRTRALLGARLVKEGGLVGRSRVMESVRRRLAGAARHSDLPTLLLGETGTGKLQAARALHALDAERHAQAFHSVDCGSIVEGLFGSELFGHAHGAFTGARSARSGAIATAGGGTLLLDEIGELGPTLQASFLSALQERRYRPVGSDREYEMRCRIMAATNRDLPALVDRGAFRADLFFRLDGMRVELPPLRERREDIPELFQHLVQRRHPAGTEVEIDADVLEALGDRDWPGNVRELETVAQRCARAAGDRARIRLAHLASQGLGEPRRTVVDVPEEESVESLVRSGVALEEIVAACRRRAVEVALHLAAGVNGGGRSEQVEAAAIRLGVSRRTLYNVLKELPPA